MKRLGVFLVAVVTSTVSMLAKPARAADVTRVASSFDKDHPFGFYLDLKFEQTGEHGKIVREHHQDGALADVGELKYSASRSQLEVDAHIGLYRDLELSIGVPIVFGQNETWDYAEGTDATNSTITHNCLRPDGTLTDPNCLATGTGEQPIFPVPGHTYRGGMGDIHFGLAYAFFNQKRDDTKPTWVVGLDYEAPTATRRDPYQPTSKDAKGHIGDRVHKYTFYTAFSRKMSRAVEPYFKLSYMIPVNGPGWYSNCDHPDGAVLDHPENCGTKTWSRKATGMNFPHVVGTTFGAELTPFQNLSVHQRIMIDLHGTAQYVGAGRYYNELSGVFHKLMRSDSYLHVGGGIGVTAQAAEYVSFRATGDMFYNTEHWLSDESMGKDLDGNGQVDLATGEVNPNFDFRADLTGHRFRITENSTFRFTLQATFNF